VVLDEIAENSEEKLEILLGFLAEIDYALVSVDNEVRACTVNGVRSINAMLGYHGIDIFPPSMIVEKD